MRSSHLFYEANILLFSCRQFADVDIPWPFMNLRERYTDRMICANSADPEITATSCQGDSGGPMVREVRCALNFRKQSFFTILSYSGFPQTFL